MKRASEVSTGSEIEEVLIERFSRATRDCVYFDPANSESLRLTASAWPGKTLVIACGLKPDNARDADPCNLGSRGANFHQWGGEQVRSGAASQCRLSVDSNLLLMHNRDQALLYSNETAPEPLPAHYRDVMALACRLRPARALIIVNLHGSGASAPQHFHAQVFPLTRSRRPNTIRSLLMNLDVKRASSPLAADAKVTLNEIAWPFWGFRLTFPQTYSPQKVGEILFETAHHRVRYRSQLAFSYNLYVDTSHPYRVYVLVKYSDRENVMALPEVQRLMATKIRDRRRRDVSRSNNARWRWAWLETLGGLLGRDRTFFDTKTFDFDFWARVYSLVSICEDHRERIREVLLRMG